MNRRLVWEADVAELKAAVMRLEARVGARMRASTRMHQNCNLHLICACVWEAAQDKAAAQESCWAAEKAFEL